ncbi:MAG: hypothetical protein ABSC23_03190 [Bryobacteraceae bacterium]
MNVAFAAAAKQESPFGVWTRTSRIPGDAPAAMVMFAVILRIDGQRANALTQKDTLRFHGCLRHLHGFCAPDQPAPHGSQNRNCVSNVWSLTSTWATDVPQPDWAGNAKRIR